MYNNYKILEVTKENEQQYLPDIVELEETVLKKMEQEGKKGQLFITGEEGISEYIHSDSNHVMIAVTNSTINPTISATYITQGQIDFTYNDITKYFKCGEDYQKYVKSKYVGNEFEKAVREVYIEKICAYRYARNLILKEQGVEFLDNMGEDERNAVFLEMVEKEHANPQNQFHEKSEIRDGLNKYMSLYMKHIAKDSERYQDFYWVDFQFLKSNLNSAETMDEMSSKFKTFDSTICAYDKLLEYQKYKIYDKSHCKNISKYYVANTDNTIELDTYITHPNSRENGIARVLVLEGIKKSLARVMRNEKNKNIFLVSTLHEDNLSSKYVSEFFGLKDYLFVNRRNGRDRQVHILGIERDKVPEYIDKIEKRVAVLYGYNPRGIKISDKDKISIFNEQIAYEVGELEKLNAVKDVGKRKKYAGYISGKQSKINSLHKLVRKLENCKDNSVKSK